MPSSRFRVVLDTNAVLRGLASENSAAARLISAAENRQFITLLSRPVLMEYAAVLSNPDVARRFPSLSARRVAVTLARLRYTGSYIRSVSRRFEFARDPRDAKVIELAIAGSATHIITHDRDLLSLPTGHSDTCKRFRQRLPGVQVLQTGEFLARFGEELGIARP